MPRSGHKHEERRHGAERIRVSSLERVLLEASSKEADQSAVNIGGLFLFDGTPPVLEDLRRLLTGQAGQAPVLGYKLSSGATHWERDPAFQAGRHVQELQARPGTDVLAAAQQAVAQPFDRGRPMWRLVLIHGYSATEYALCYCAHHAYQDGLAIEGTIQALFGAGTLPEPAGNELSAKVRPWNWPAPRKLGFPLAPTFDWSVTRRPLTGQRKVLSFDLDQAALQDITRATGASRNQVCLATLAGALSDWTPGDWATPTRRARRGPHIGMPLNLRSAESSACLGNQFGMMRLPLPCHRPCPVDQLTDVMRRTGARQLQRQREIHASFQRLPGFVVRPMARRSTHPRYLTMGVSTVRTDRITVAGTEVRAIFALPPLLPGHHMMIVLFQYGDQVTPTLIFDGAIGDADRLERLWQRSLIRLRDALDTKGSLGR
ncbi:wax ester/triacylglycerol synthase family O-acyltransferase [Actinomadura fulvescens]|uniref:diacylglycerol O-acyltransferase n=1 Tax=Actinomadura fulvescens TaxID=46160 RepID=A0ABN3QWB0_9ACTN